MSVFTKAIKRLLTSQALLTNLCPQLRANQMIRSIFFLLRKSNWFLIGWRVLLVLTQGIQPICGKAQCGVNDRSYIRCLGPYFSEKNRYSYKSDFTVCQLLRPMISMRRSEWKLRGSQQRRVLLHTHGDTMSQVFCKGMSEVLQIMLQLLYLRQDFQKMQQLHNSYFSWKHSGLITDSKVNRGCITQSAFENLIILV